MSAEVQKQTSKSEAAAAPAIKSIRLVQSAPFNGREEESIRMGVGQCTLAVAARIESDGTAVAIGPNQRADGLLLECLRHDRVTLKTFTERIFVAWSNIRCVVY